jgi:hypothetical protein
VPSFRFAIRQFIGPMDGFTGSVVAGRVLNADPKLSVGDWLEIQGPSWRLRVRCTGFRLIRLQHQDWIPIAIAGLPHGIDVIGLMAGKDHSQGALPPAATVAPQPQTP